MPQDSPFPRIVLCCFVVFGGCLITFYSPPSLTRPTERNRTTAGRGEQENRAKQRGHNSHPNETPSIAKELAQGIPVPCHHSSCHHLQAMGAQAGKPQSGSRPQQPGG